MSVRWVQLGGSLSILWHCISLRLEWKLTFSSPAAIAVFQICWHIECSTSTALSFRVWNSLAGIPSPPLALLIVMLPKSHLTLHSKMSGTRWVITPSWLSRSLRLFCFSSVHSLSRVWLFDPMNRSTTLQPPSPSSSPGVHSVRLTSIESVMPSSHLILGHPFSSCPQSFPASESFPMSQLFASGGQSTGVFSFSIIPSKEIPGPISFRMDWLDLLAVQGTLKSLLQHYSSKASILRCSAFFTVQHIHTWPLEKP